MRGKCRVRLARSQDALAVRWGEELTAQVTGIPAVPLMQNGHDRFYAPTSDVDVVFDATGANLAGGGGIMRIDRRKEP